MDTTKIKNVIRGHKNGVLSIAGGAVIDVLEEAAEILTDVKNTLDADDPQLIKTGLDKGVGHLDGLRIELQEALLDSLDKP